jgi:flagellar protein FlgJ
MITQSTTAPSAASVIRQSIHEASKLGPKVDAGRLLESRADQVREGEEDQPELREAFHQFVGESFFGMLLKTMRQSVGKAPYFHGGQAEEIFQGQMDQMLSERMTKASAASFAEPMYELFSLKR